MTVKVQSTRLSRETLDACARFASIIGDDYPNLIVELENTLVMAADLGYTDALIDQSIKALEALRTEPETFPNDLNWDQVGNGKLSGEVH